MQPILENRAAIGAPPASPVYRKMSVLMPIDNNRWTLHGAVERVFSSPLPLEIELVAVDDCSADGSAELLDELARAEPRIKVIHQMEKRGSGSAILTAIDRMAGDIAVVQDARLEYDPHALPQLVKPILDNQADAVYGSRFMAGPGPVLPRRQHLRSGIVNFLSNVLNNQRLTDVETCYTVVRGDILRQLCLRGAPSGFEAEMTCRLAQWGARLYELPIHYSADPNPDAKRAVARIGRAVRRLKAVGEILRCRFVSPQFTKHSGFYILTAVAKATSYNRWILKEVRGYLGQRILEAGSGIGNLSDMLLDRQRLILSDYEDIYIRALRNRYAGRGNVRVDPIDLTNSRQYEIWQGEKIDTVFCSNVLEHLGPDLQVLRDFHETLEPGGHCVIVVPAGQWLYCGMDEELGHFRRYSKQDLADKMSAAGFEIVFTKQFSRLGSLSWKVSGGLLGRRHLSPRQMILFDRIVPLAKLLDHVLPVPGMSLVMVGRKPVTTAQRTVADRQAA